jgi:hypothetical protein
VLREEQRGVRVERGAKGIAGLAIEVYLCILDPVSRWVHPVLAQRRIVQSRHPPAQYPNSGSGLEVRGLGSRVSSFAFRVKS